MLEIDVIRFSQVTDSQLHFSEATCTWTPQTKTQDATFALAEVLATTDAKARAKPLWLW